MNTPTNSNFDKLLSHFKLGKTNGNQIQAFCPAHEDKKPSMSITISGDKALIFCHAGCEIHDILSAAKLTYSDLFLSDVPNNIYQYRKEDNDLSHEKVKYVNPKNPKDKTFRQRRIENGNIVDNLGDIPRIPYNLPTLIKAIKEDKLIVYVEGEKDANTAKVIGYASTTMGSASDWKKEYATFFKKANLVLIPDKDKAGLNLTQKMIDDLKPVVRSLKIVILPDGKDLTEWVEAGNKDLNSLILKADDLVPFAGLPKPKITKQLTGYLFEWDSLPVTVKIDRLSDDLEGIIKVTDINKKVVIHHSKINLLAPRSLSELANKLKLSVSCDWNTILSQVAIECNNIAEFVGECENINAEPITMELVYLLDPILPLGEPTTIFTSGGKGKSIIADYFATLVQYGICGDLPSIIPRQANVLYLDWEGDKETHRRYITAIKNGLGWNGSIPTCEIRYLHLDHPLAQVADGIKEIISKYNIEFVIIDSQMAATATGTRGLTEAQVASEYYNVLRSFNVTTLTIDHITKQSMNSDNTTDAPYGSVVKYNRSRSQFELKLADDMDDADVKEYALIHKKFNLGRKQKPIGIRAEFTNNGNVLEKITFTNCNIADNPELSNKVLSKTQMAINYLKQVGKASIESIALAINHPQDKTGILLANKKNVFTKLSSGYYGLKTIDNYDGESLV